MINTIFTKSRDGVSIIAYLQNIINEEIAHSRSNTNLLNSSVSFQDVIIASSLLPLTENPAQEISNAWGPMTRAFHVQKVRRDNQSNCVIPSLEYSFITETHSIHLFIF